MKLEVHGCEERYTIEQSLLNLFPGELPVYGPVQPEDESWAVFDCLEDNDGYQVDLRLSWNGRTVSRQARQVLQARRSSGRASGGISSGPAFFWRTGS